MTLIDFLITKGVPRSVAEKFPGYLKKNPRVWKEYKRFAFEAINSGQVIGSRAVFERMRWESMILKGEDGFAVNNNYSACYAHLFMWKYPQHSGYFETRARRAA